MVWLVFVRLNPSSSRGRRSSSRSSKHEQEQEEEAKAASPKNLQTRWSSYRDVGMYVVRRAGFTKCVP